MLLDRADRRVADNLDKHLRSAGRRTIVVASATPPIGQHPPKQGRELEEEEISSDTTIALEHQLAVAEIERFRDYLAQNYPPANPDLIVELLVSDPSLFALLYRLIPDTRWNIRDVLVQEYQQLVEGLGSFRPPKPQSLGGHTLKEQLRAWLSRQGESAVSLASVSSVSDPWYRIATELPQLVLLFSSLDEPISLNLLTKRFSGLLQVYTAMRESLENSGLFVEVELDKQNDIGLTAVNPFVAELLLGAAVPSSVARLDLLANLLYEFPWDPDSRPSDAPEQALLVHLIRSIASPTGAFQADYQRTEDLRKLAEILETLREKNGATLPQLMLIEGIVLRHIGRRQADNAKGMEAIRMYRQSRAVLELAREVLSHRQASPARNFEMAMVLNAIAATIGHSFMAESKDSAVDQAECRKLIDTALTTASQSRAYTENYYPLDTAYWTNRNYYRYLSDQPDSEEIQADRQRALISMADSLDKAGELGELPLIQSEKLEERLIEFETILNNYPAAEQRAEVDASNGRYGGLCLLARIRAIDTKTNKIISATQAKSALEYLERFAPRILGDDRALTLMHRLWVGGHLENLQLDEGPHAIGCVMNEWMQLERIAQARRTIGGNTRIPYINFWLAVALAQQGDMRRALQTLEEIQANSLSFTHRRLTPLIYLSDVSGQPTTFGAIVRRRDENDLLTLFVPAIAIEVTMSKRYQGQEVMNLRRADETKVLIALNYWHPSAVDPSWEKARAKPHEGRRQQGISR